MNQKIGDLGIEALEAVPWGTHICQFYETKRDLIEILVSYFKDGLKNNQYCLWVVSEPLVEKDAKEAMKKAVPNFDLYLETAQMEIIPLNEFYVRGGSFDMESALNDWILKLDRASARGYDGVRISFNSNVHGQKSRRDITDNESMIQGIIGKNRIQVICTYPLEKCGSSEVIDIVSQHQLALVRREGLWKSVENTMCIQMLEELKESELRYKRLVLGLPDIVWSRSTKRGIIFVSDRVEEILGCSPDYLYRHPHLWTTSIHPDDQNRVSRAIRDFEAGKDLDVEYRIKDCSGNWMWFHDRSIGKRQEAEEMIIEGISTDITKRKLAEQKLRESKENLAEAQKVAHVGSWEWNMIEDKLSWSDEAYRQFGLMPDEITPDYATFESFIHPEDLEYVSRRIELAKAGKKPYSVEARMIRKDGTEWIMHAHGTVHRDKDGRAVKFIGTTQDITERKQAEKKLRESEEKYRQLFSTVPDSIILFDAETKGFIDVNDACVDLYGHSKEEFMKIRLTDITAEPEETLIAIGETLDKKLIRIPIRYHKKKDTKEFPVEISASSFIFNDRPVVCGVIRDITERKKEEKRLRESELQLQEQKLALEQKNIALKEIIAQVEAEKRKISDTIMTNVDIIIRPILKKLRANKSIAKYADLIEHHMDGLVSSYGGFITRKTFRLSPREIEICNLVKSGLSSKDISHLLNISFRTVEKHRENIRHKLALSNKEINLTSYLREV